MNRTWTSEYNRGSLVIDIVDAKTNKLVWQGVGSGINVDSPKSKQNKSPAIVTEMMANYPPVKNKISLNFLLIVLKFQGCLLAS